MNKQEREYHYRMVSRLENMGFHMGEIEKLRRISKTLQTWAVHECNGTIQRDEDTGKCYWYSPNTGDRLGWTSDRETGALNRLQSIMDNHQGYRSYHQGDPRGPMLWIVEDSDRDILSAYPDGVAIF